MCMKKGNIGSTLVEALISVSIVSVGALGLVNLQGNMIRNRVEADQSNEARILAKAKIEELRNYGTEAEYNAIQSGQDDAPITGTTASYTRSWAVTDFSSPDYKTVAVTVSWSDRNGTDQQLIINSDIGLLSLVNAGKAMESTVADVPLEPPNANYIGNQGDDQAPAEEEPPVEEEQQQEEEEVQNDDDSTYTLVEQGATLVFDSNTDEIISIDGHPAVVISGSMDNPSSNGNSANVNLDNVTISVSSNGSGVCIRADAGADPVSYTCYLQNASTVTITPSNISGVKLCASMSSNTYTNQTTSLTGQNYEFYKTNKSCSGSTPNDLGNQ
jgi:Tfp pilus assembly protein PilV